MGGSGAGPRRPRHPAHRSSDPPHSRCRIRACFLMPRHCPPLLPAASARLCLWLLHNASPFAGLRRPLTPGGRRTVALLPWKARFTARPSSAKQSQNFGGKQDPSPCYINPILHPKASTAGQIKPKAKSGNQIIKNTPLQPPAKPSFGSVPRAVRDPLKSLLPSEKNLYLRKSQALSPAPPTPQTRRRKSREDKKRSESENYHG